MDDKLINVITRLNIHILKFPIAADDDIDRINVQWSVGLLMISSTIVTFCQYSTAQIICMIPAEWPAPWNSYAENYCWIQQTYFVSDEIVGKDGDKQMAQSVPKSQEERLNISIYYYQWIPLFLIIQATLYLLPHIIWRRISCQAGYDVNQFMKYAAKIDQINDASERKKSIRHLSQQILMSLTSHQIEGKSDRYDWQLCDRMFSSSRFLIVLHLLKKIMFLINAMVQLFLMQKFLGFDSMFWGFTLSTTLLEGTSWIRTGIFPRSTYCDLPIKQIGQSAIETFQCVLPLNMINEKIYLFLWFWTIWCIFVNVISCIKCLSCVLRAPYQLTLSNKWIDSQDLNDDRVMRFIEDYLGHDGIFILSSISYNINDVMTLNILKDMWLCWLNELQDEHYID